MTRATFLLSGLLSIGLATSAAAERVEWKAADGGNGHSYEVVTVGADELISFTDAQRAAEEQGGHLATIASEEENKFVFKLVDDEKYWGSDGYNGHGPWLGGFQGAEAKDVDDGWQWITEEKWDYTNWSPGASEPNDSDGYEDRQEDYLHYFSFGSTDPSPQWNDSPNNAGSVRAYVIEWTPKKELEATAAAASGDDMPQAESE